MGIICVLAINYEFVSIADHVFFIPFLSFFGLLLASAPIYLKPGNRSLVNPPGMGGVGRGCLTNPVPFRLLAL